MERILFLLLLMEFGLEQRLPVKYKYSCDKCYSTAEYGLYSRIYLSLRIYVSLRNFGLFICRLRLLPLYGMNFYRTSLYCLILFKGGHLWMPVNFSDLCKFS